MFRSSSLEGNTPIDNISAFHALGGLNMYLDTSPQHNNNNNMYLDTSSQHNSNMSPPISVSAPLSPPTTPLTPEHSTMSSTQFPLLTDNVQLNTANALLLQRQYQYHLLIQHHQQQIALAQHQLALAASAAAANHHQKDEIAHSLKMFALLTACNADNASGSTSDAMHDFAANGYVSDDFNRFNCATPQPQQPQQQLLRQQFPSATTTVAGNSANAAGVLPSPLAATQLNLNNWEHLNNVWRSMSMAYMPNNTAVNASIALASASQKTTQTPVVVAVPPDHVRNVTNVNITNNNNNKQQKRYNNSKPKEQVQRHCVFCENNNEPEAVVNSHSVRDTFGRVLCPKLRTYVCPICGASGDSAHTIKYCPKKPIVTMEDAIKAESFRLTKSNYYKQQMKV
ncbi:protein nanos [Drosophila grimshawi]|uniref:GH19104 n=1 Tax=Drosophila grimshawi TaxID=7222 RepID=B4JIJ0_DROGR|nr:protein nanos [Drosophila grimshawi]EDV93071.1 GH19104 [Drosophila grimshawi]